MEKVIYAKYNRTRAPEFQLKTEIILRDGVRYVYKEALNDTALKHIDNLAINQKLLDGLYENINIVNVSIDKSRAEFPFVEGMTITEKLDELLINKDIDRLLKAIRDHLDNTIAYKSEKLVKFSKTDTFCEIFGELDADCMAVATANLDEIFDNIICNDEGYHLIDYEWVFDCPIPVDFLHFRTVYYYYVKQYNYLRGIIPLDEYLAYFGFDENMTPIWLNLDDRFQQYAHGENRKYIYTNNYVKATHNITQVLNSYRDVGKTLDEINRDIIQKNNEIKQKDKNICDYQKNERVLNEIIRNQRRYLGMPHSPLHYIKAGAKKLSKKS